MFDYEEKFYELRENIDRTYDACCYHNSKSNIEKYREAFEEYQNFCVVVLEKLMEEHSDVLARLKNN